MSQVLIAVVDDEVDLLENFKLLLADQFEVEAFSSPFDFLKALPDLQKRGLRLLITDFKMPRMNGLEMVQKAQALDPSLPFLILSGFLDKKTVMDAVDLGVFRLLEKPCQPDELFSSIDQVLTESELHIVRQEIREITSQLRELYSTVRLTLMQYIPEETLERLVIDPSSETETKKMSFDDLLENLEMRLDRLLASEKVMNDLADQRNKKPA